MRPQRFHRLSRVLSRRQPDLTVLMEKVHKSHNFSAILRNCDAV
ncbi:MAG: tRNA (guanine-N2)-dimethyltransferase, partial [Gemmatimonadota bacterium]